MNNLIRKITLKSVWIKLINQWKTDSIEKIKQMVEEYRQNLTNYTNKYMNELQNELNEIDLSRCKRELNKLEEELSKLSDISIKQESTVFINKIHVIIPHDTSNNYIYIHMNIENYFY